MTGGVESLYPFLYRDDDAGGADVTAVLDEVRRSTAEKAEEIVALRRRITTEHAERLADCARVLAGSFRAGGRLFTFGNGGSSTDAQAVAQLFLDPGPAWRPLPAIALTTDVAVVTALSNDIGFEVVFARQLAAFARPGDIALGLSTSGGSVNVLRAFEEAVRLDLVTVGFAGGDGGRLGTTGTVKYLFGIPSASVHRIQEAQTTAYHVLWELTQSAL